MASRHDLAIKALGIIAAAAIAAACDGSEPGRASAAAVAPTVAALSVAAAAATPAATDIPTAGPTDPHGEPSPGTATSPPQVPLIEQDIAYGESATRNLVGFLAMPADATEPLPGIIAIHDASGLTDDIKVTARQLAARGYVVLAVDLFGGVRANTPEEAQPLLKALITDPDAARTNLKLAYEYLDKYALAPKIGTIGWSLGGGWSLQTALMLPDQIDAVVMYYGQIVNRESALDTLKMPILGFFGGLDESVAVRDVQYFRSTLSSLGKPAEIVIYSGARQGFASPQSANYDAKAAAESWEKTTAFLEQSLRRAPQ
jgi:carboxymethylenebutenolidase